MLIENRKAYHDYFILEELECGIELKGREVKSLRGGDKASIKEAYCEITPNNELMIVNMHIAKCIYAFDFDLDEKRTRRLLAHKSEILKLKNKSVEKGMTIIPLKVYFKDGKTKVLIGLCKGKKNYDKREAIKQRDIKRDMERNSL